MGYFIEIFTKSFAGTFNIFNDTPAVTIAVYSSAYVLGVIWENRRTWRGKLTEVLIRLIKGFKWPLVVACVVFLFHFCILVPKATVSQSREAYTIATNNLTTFRKEHIDFENYKEEKRAKERTKEMAEAMANPDRARAVLVVAAKEPIRIPNLNGVFTLDAARDLENQVKIKNSALEELLKIDRDADSKRSEQQNGEQTAKEKSERNEKVSKFDYTVRKFLANLKDLAASTGDSVFDNYIGFDENSGEFRTKIPPKAAIGSRRAVPKVFARLNGNKNWSFDMMLIGLRRDTLIITTQHDEEYPTVSSMGYVVAPLNPKKITGEFSFYSTHGIGSKVLMFGQEPFMNGVGKFEPNEWVEQFTYTLAKMILEQDRIYPLKPKESR